jgi:hypothetical protein
LSAQQLMLATGLPAPANVNGGSAPAPPANVNGGWVGVRGSDRFVDLDARGSGRIDETHV